MIVLPPNIIILHDCTYILSYRVQSRVKGQHRKMGLTEYLGVLTGAYSAQ